MGKLLQTFNYPRNAFAASPAASAQKVLAVIDRAERNDLLRVGGSLKDEPFNDMRLFLAVVGGPANAPYVTSLGQSFRGLALDSPPGAWRWILTRAMWLYSMPNGSNTAGSTAGRDLGVRFNFFDMVSRLAVRLSALQQPSNILFFDELLAVLTDDSAWVLPGQELYDLVLEKRDQLGPLGETEHQSLLGELETTYSLAREDMNTLFRKAFGQCGLFDIVTSQRKPVGLRLDTATYTNPVLGERLRFILDNPRVFDEESV